MGWTDRAPSMPAQRELEKLPKATPTRIRRKVGARGFMYAGKPVAEGESLVCDHDIAAMLVKLGKAEYVSP